MPKYVTALIAIDPSSMEDADIKRALGDIKKLFTNNDNARKMTFAHATSLSKTVSALFAALNQDSPGGKAMSKDDKKAAMVDAMINKKGLNLSAVWNLCDKAKICEGSADIFAGDAAVLKKQFVKKINSGI